MDLNDFLKRLPFYVATGTTMALLFWLAWFHIRIFLGLSIVVMFTVVFFVVTKALGDVFYDSYEDWKRRKKR